MMSREASPAPVEALCPVLRDRGDPLAHTRSAGEQQMVAIARGLVARPRLGVVSTDVRLTRIEPGRA
jgi:ABC-type branched-subunit amino acid transport system ATPase component